MNHMDNMDALLLSQIKQPQGVSPTLCDQFLRGRCGEWVEWKRRHKCPEPYKEADVLLDKGRKETAKMLLEILIKDREAHLEEVAQGEMGYFNQRFVGTVQYLLFWVDGWYPAQLSPGEWAAEEAEKRGEGYMKLRLRGFSRHYDKLIKVDDPRLRRQLVLLTKPEHLVCGYFPKVGDFVKVLLVDDFEAAYFLCRKGYTPPSAPVQQEKRYESSVDGMEGMWAPVGIVKRNLPLRDQAEVEVNFLCCTERIRVCNTHVVKITEEEYHESHKRILEARLEGTSVIEAMLGQEGPRMLLRQAVTISGVRCLLAFWQCYDRIKIRLYNIPQSRIHIMEADEGDLKARGLLKDQERLLDLFLDRKEAMCRELAKHVAVTSGEVYLLPVDPAVPNNLVCRPGAHDQFLYKVQGKLRLVDVEVELRAADKDKVTIHINHLISPVHGSHAYPMESIPLVMWRDLGFPDLDWLKEADRGRLCWEILRCLDTCQGYPVVVICNQVVLPIYFDPFDNTEDHRVRQSQSGKGKESVVDVEKNRGFEWRWLRRLAVYKCEEQLDTCDHSSAPCERYIITAKFRGDGSLQFHAFTSPGGRGRDGSSGNNGALSLELTIQDWHMLGYGPLLWASEAQRDFLCNLFSDRLKLVDGALFFDVTPVLGYRMEGELNADDTDDDRGAIVIKVRDLGKSFAVESYHGMSSSTPLHTIMVDEASLKAFGFTVRSIKWIPSPVRQHLCRRLALLSTIGADGGLTINQGGVLVWRGVLRKLRQGNGPFMVSVYDWGEVLEVSYRDFKGGLLEQSHLPLKDFQAMVGREVWPMTMADDTKDKTFRQLCQAIGARATILSSFDRFLSLRPKDDRDRLAAIELPKQDTVVTEDDVIAHIQKIRPDPSKLRPKEMHLLHQLLFVMQETDRITGVDKRVRERDARKPKAKGMRCRSLYQKDPPPPPRICQCCYQEATHRHGKSCTHEYGLCHVCIIKSHIKMSETKNQHRHELLPQLFMDLRPTTEHDITQAQRQQIIRKRMLDSNKAAESRRKDLASLLSSHLKFYVGVEIAPKVGPPKGKGKKVAKERPRSAISDVSGIQSVTSSVTGAFDHEQVDGMFTEGPHDIAIGPEGSTSTYSLDGDSHEIVTDDSTDKAGGEEVKSPEKMDDQALLEAVAHVLLSMLRKVPHRVHKILKKRQRAQQREELKVLFEELIEAVEKRAERMAKRSQLVKKQARLNYFARREVQLVLAQMVQSLSNGHADQLKRRDTAAKENNITDGHQSLEVADPLSDHALRATSIDLGLGIPIAVTTKATMMPSQGTFPLDEPLIVSERLLAEQVDPTRDEVRQVVPDPLTLRLDLLGKDMGVQEVKKAIAQEDGLTQNMVPLLPIMVPVDIMDTYDGQGSAKDQEDKTQKEPLLGESCSGEMAPQVISHVMTQEAPQHIIESSRCHSPRPMGPASPRPGVPQAFEPLTDSITFGKVMIHLGDQDTAGGLPLSETRGSDAFMESLKGIQPVRVMQLPPLFDEPIVPLRQKVATMDVLQPSMADTPPPPTISMSLLASMQPVQASPASSASSPPSPQPPPLITAPPPPPPFNPDDIVITIHPVPAITRQQVQQVLHEVIGAVSEGACCPIQEGDHPGTCGDGWLRPVNELLAYPLMVADAREEVAACLEDLVTGVEQVDYALSCEQQAYYEETRMEVWQVILDLVTLVEHRVEPPPTPTSELESLPPYSPSLLRTRLEEHLTYGATTATKLVEMDVYECNICGEDIDEESDGRFHCLQCPDFDMCYYCYFKHPVSGDHTAHHQIMFINALGGQVLSSNASSQSSVTLEAALEQPPWWAQEEQPQPPPTEGRESNGES